MTSGTGLAGMSMPDWRSRLPVKMADAGIPFLDISALWFVNIQSKFNAPPPAVYGHAMCIPVHHKQYGGHAGCLSLSTTSSMDNGHAGYLSTTNRMYCTSSCRLSFSMNVQRFFPPPAVWTCRVSVHHQQYERAGCLSTTNSRDVQFFKSSFNP